MIERTLVALKPDAVQRGLVGEIVQRFEKVGLKIVGMKMKWVDEEFAKKHYTEDISIRRGEHVRRYLVEFLLVGPVIAMVLEGVDAIEVCRKMVGATEPKTAAPGTIRGDFSHVSYDYCDKKEMVVKNVIHASSDQNDAKHEIDLWFSKAELHDYKSVHDVHIFD
jgi:nucleoside-diphosphate kinase